MQRIVKCRKPEDCVKQRLICQGVVNKAHCQKATVVVFEEVMAVINGALVITKIELVVVFEPRPLQVIM